MLENLQKGTLKSFMMLCHGIVSVNKSKILKENLMLAIH